ncbi:MAG: arginine--tRNA ligase, partial [Bacteroidetes bacterium]|nr:arginine--tRNA ligase [Bacteroidota bacterium]
MRDYLDAQLRAVLDAMDGVPDDFEPELEKPAQPEHGDLATNTAMRLASVLKNNPRAIAEDLADRLREQVDPRRIASIAVAGPGFINFRFAETYLVDALAGVLAAGDDYGRSDDHAGETALVEYVSANPTGPLTVGHGRNAVLGDTVANLLDWTGYDVTREYYFNDAGRQMRVLGASVRARYQALVDPDTPTHTLTL